MLGDMLWALILLAVIVLVVRGFRGRGARDPALLRLAALEEEMRELRGQLRTLVERVWFLERGQVAPGSIPGEPGRVPPAAPDVGAAGPAEPEIFPASVAPPLPPPRADLEQRIGARWATWLGVVAILVALAFFLRWALEREVFGPVPRVLVGVAAGIALLTTGQRMHRRADLPYLSEGLSGGGLGALYLSLYAAHTFYALIGAAAALYLMFVITVAGAVVAVTSHRQITAMLALLGGLLTPVLLATGRPDERVLLGYLLVLDCLALAVARYRSWPAVGYVAWLGTALLVWPGLWRAPEPGVVTVRLVLLSVIFAVFIALPLLRELAERRRERQLDIGLVVLNAAGYFYAVHATLEWSAPAAQGPSALALAVVYALVADQCRRRLPEDRVGAVTHLGVAIVFVTVGLGLVLRGPWITLGWAAQGAALLALARWARGPVVSWGGVGALMLAAVRVLWVDPAWHPPLERVWNAAFLVHLVVVAALALGGACAARVPSHERRFAPERARDALWIVAAGVLAALLWREPPGLWPAGLLSLELAVLGWLGRATRAPAFLVAAPLLAAVVVSRIFGADGPLARRAAASLLNPPLAVRVAGCMAMGLAGAWLARAAAGAWWIGVGRALSGAAGISLLAALSASWVAHQEVAMAAARRASDWTGAEELRWRMQIGLSILWTAFAAAALGWGFARSRPVVRYGALGLLGVVIAKVFFVDLAAVQTGYRIVSLLVLGLVLLGVSYLYQRGRR